MKLDWMFQISFASDIARVRKVLDNILLYALILVPVICKKMLYICKNDFTSLKFLGK